MKVTFEKDYRSRYTLEELDQAKAVIACMKDYDETPKSAAETAASAAAALKGDGLRAILTAEATTAKNGRIGYDETCGGSGWFDVWIDYTAETWRGFIKGGAYLSDIWRISADDDRTEHAYIRYFTEK